LFTFLGDRRGARGRPPGYLAVSFLADRAVIGSIVWIAARKGYLPPIPRALRHREICQQCGDSGRLTRCGKFNDFTPAALDRIKGLGSTHIWFTGIIEHATCTDYSAYGIAKDNPQVVKGRAGSPYAIKDYFDVCPDFASHPSVRMSEFEALLSRTHDSGLGVIIDFVPNHVARSYKSDVSPLISQKDLGEDDDANKHFSTQNNFYYLLDQHFAAPHNSYPYALNAENYSEYPAKATGNDAFTAAPSINDWYETVKLNYGVDYLAGRINNFDPIPDTWIKMKSILLYWAAKGVDGFRCDMAEMVPVAFWSWVIKEVKAEYPSILFIAEVYNPAEYRNYLNIGGFDYLYDKVGLYDVVRGVMEGAQPATKITECWQRHDEINDRMLRFLENHDEQRIASSQFSCDSWMGIPGMIVSACMHTGPVMVYFGQELGEPALDAEGFSGKDGRTTIFDYWHNDIYSRWINGGLFDGGALNADELNLQAFYQRLLTLCNAEKALHKGGFYDLMWVNYSNLDCSKIYAFLRHYKDDILLILANFDPFAGKKFYLKFPPHLISYLQLPFDSEWRATELLWGEDAFTFSVNDIISEGVHISIDKKSGGIYKLSRI
jgi:glycosidase